jgi:hypothetical protein
MTGRQGVARPIIRAGVSSQSLTSARSEIAIGIERVTLNHEDMWTASSGRPAGTFGQAPASITASGLEGGL